MDWDSGIALQSLSTRAAESEGMWLATTARRQRWGRVRRSWRCPPGDAAGGGEPGTGSRAGGGQAHSLTPPASGAAVAVCPCWVSVFAEPL